ncbi:9358_t:CDS:2 [Dentiscutata heterogama]|uniref:9358_t:CDS:1 n=1 Tax=Dentiscutata heterogama TaxID=1316150 RepID=A0ACA9MH03_9GLOM|nr:9358_t:CDS:2 [Dentiscutata heterogama]
MGSLFRPTHCCCCISLRAGSIIITILWLLGSLAQIISSLQAIVQQGKCTDCPYSEGYYIVNLILHAIFVLIAVFGIMVLCCRNESGDASQGNQDCKDFSYKTVLIINVVAYGVATLISIHYASVISAYSSLRSTEEENSNMDK